MLSGKVAVDKTYQMPDNSRSLIEQMERNTGLSRMAGVLEGMDRKDYAILTLALIAATTGDIAYRAISMIEGTILAANEMGDTATLAQETASKHIDEADVNSHKIHAELMTCLKGEEKSVLLLYDCLADQELSRYGWYDCEDSLEAQIEKTEEANRKLDRVLEISDGLEAISNEAVSIADKSARLAGKSVKMCDAVVEKAASGHMAELRECAAALAECREGKQK